MSKQTIRDKWEKLNSVMVDIPEDEECRAYFTVMLSGERFAKLFAGFEVQSFDDGGYWVEWNGITWQTYTHPRLPQRVTLPKWGDSQ